MKPPAGTAAYWDLESDQYSAVRRPSEVDHFTLDACPPLGNVLELGAGPGVFTRQLLALRAPASAGEICVTDISPRFCATLRALPVQVRCCAHQTLAMSPRSVTTAYAMATLHHLSGRDRRDLLERLAGWLRPEGHFALVEDWAFEASTEAQARLADLRQALRDHEAASEHHPSEATWIQDLEDAGFDLVRHAQVERRERLERYRVLNDPTSRAHLAWLEARPQLARVPMSVFVARAGPGGS